MAQPKLALRLFAASALALAMAACNDDTRARVDAPEPASLAELAVISDLPPAEPAPVRDYLPARGYPLAERAYGLQQAFYDVPPDYGFAYDDGRSYVWETADDWEMYAEPWDDGYRYYYYEPGAAYPYFVRDGSYGYGFSSVGVLIAVFDAGGRYMPRDYAYRAAPMAGRYWSRGHELWQARRVSPRFQVTEQVWVEQAPRLVRTSDPWIRAAREDRDWRAWRDRDNDRELRRFTREQQRREASAAAWRQRVAQQEARDDRRFPWADRRDERRDDGRVQAERERVFAEQRRGAERRTEFVNRDQQQRQVVLAQRQARAEQVGRKQAEHRAAEMRVADRRQRQEREQARGQLQAERRQQQAQAERGRQEQLVRVEQRQRQQAERQQQRLQAVQAERQGRERAHQQARQEQHARQQAERQQQRQQAMQAERQGRERAQQQARQEQQQARAQQQQQARQEQQQARQAAQAQQQQARQAQQQQARAAEQQARNANAREARPDRGRGQGKDKERN